ncbi:MAG: tetratricopeptide repeat protein [Nevskiaceae bacterium]|nr:MAG: tetratricopeptide repeat protein [Nevskiaceae bacterium]
MANHYEDEAEVENLKRWWNENWKSLAAGLVIGLLGIFGYQGYQRHQQSVSEQASQIYEDLKAAASASKNDEAAALGDRLVKDFSGTPYASGAALRLAELAVNQSKLDEAVTRLQWVADHGKDDGLRDLAKLRLARVLWQQQKAGDALKLLDGDHGAYNALFAELRGDIKLSAGDRVAARAAYEEAVKDTPAGANTVGLQRKLDDLADVVKS